MSQFRGPRLGFLFEASCGCLVADGCDELCALLFEFADNTGQLAFELIAPFCLSLCKLDIEARVLVSGSLSFIFERVDESRLLIYKRFELLEVLARVVLSRI